MVRGADRADIAARLRGHGFRRAAGGLIIAAYALFVVVLLVIS
jgi:hypothetical protein